MKKRMITLTLATLTALSLGACGGDKESAVKAPETTIAAAVEDETEMEIEETEAEAVEEPEASADDSADTSGLGLAEVNGLHIGLPVDFIMAETGDTSMASFTNEAGSIVIGVGSKAEVTIPADQITEDMVLETFVMGGLENAKLVNMGTVEQNGGISVVAFGTGEMSGVAMSAAMQYFYPADGSGYYTINYLYKSDETAFDDQLSIILSTVTTAE